LQVAVESGVIKYKRNGVVFYTSTRTLTYPLLVDTSLYTQGATLSSVIISGSWAGSAPPPPSSGEAVVWTAGVGVTVSGNNLTKSAATGWGNAGAVSTKTLASGDGLVEVTVAESNSHRIFGLSNGDSNPNWNDIDFGLYLNANGTLQIYEAGTGRGSFGPYATGDKLQVAVESGVIKYKRNGVVFYTSTRTLTYPLLVDTSLYTQGATLSSVIISGSWAGSAPPPPPSSGEAVVWTAGVGVSVSGNNLTKSAATGWGNAGAVSTKTLASGDGYVEVTASERTTDRMFGLSNGNSNPNWNDIDFGFYLGGNGSSPGTILVYEAGTSRGSFGPYATGDKLQVAVESGLVKYKRNGAVFYTSTRPPTYPLLVDTSLYTQGATLTSVIVSGNWQ
jgi:hypothetical protein